MSAVCYAESIEVILLLEFLYDKDTVGGGVNNG